MKRFLSLFSLLLIAAVQTWAVPATAIAQITNGETTTLCYSVSEFMNEYFEIKGTASVKLFDDIRMPDNKFIENRYNDCDITIDLNGHNIKGNISNECIIYTHESNITIVGDGVVENIGEGGEIFGSDGRIEINGGTYIAKSEICYVFQSREVIINNGKFKVPALYYYDSEDEYRFIKPTIKGGLFSIDPTECVAEDSKLVENDDEATKAEYPYKVIAPVAQITIGEETTKYYDADEFIDAFEAIRGEATVKLLGDITLPAHAKIESPNGYAEISLDLNGHNIKGNIDDGVINVSVSSLTIGGEGIVENIRAGGYAIGVSYNTFLVVNGGSYASVSEVCYVRDGCELTINAGKFKAPALYFKENGWIKPIVKGGIFSMDPSDCVAEGYEVVANDDEETKGDYPYKVVEKSLTPTAIERINADKAGKVTKTIENGRVVIIRNGERYDIAGRKL